MKQDLNSQGTPRALLAADTRTLPARLRLGVALAGMAFVAGGCASYQPQPLEVSEMRTQWLARTGSEETVRAFAAKLGSLEAKPGATPFDPTDGLSREEAEPVALLFNRELRLARLESRVSQAKADHAGRWEDPTLGFDFERVLSSVPDPWVVTGTLGFTIPISGRLAVERTLAGAEYAAELQRVAEKEWAMRSTVRRLWIEWSAATLRHELAQQLVAQLSDVSELASRQEMAGVMTRVDARLFKVELAMAEAEAIRAAARVHGSDLVLRDSLGLSPDAPVRFDRAVAYGPRGIDPAWLRANMEANNAELMTAKMAYAAAEESLRLEARKQYPDLSIAPGYGSDQGEDRVMGGIQLRLPIWNRNRQGVAEAMARRDAARGRIENAVERLNSTLAVAEGNYAAARAAREVIETRVVPLADEQDTDVQRIAALGQVDPLMLLQAMKSRYEAKVALVDGSRDEALAATVLDELIGPVTAALVQSTEVNAGQNAKTAGFEPGDTHEGAQR